METSRRGFSELYTFLRDAFQQRGLVSIPPEVLQLFKQCPLQDIDCPDIASFAKLFEGTRSSNRFRLEANSFIYTVQILFHLRPNLVQERVLHSLMVSVRLLKDEEEATRQLSELAGRKIDRFAVAKKRAIISNKLIPWLLKHFSQDSTIVRLKVMAAQFLFHLLQGDAEAKTILRFCPPRDRCSLGRSITASSHFPVRILAVNLLREISLADIDVRLFWSPDLLGNNDPRPPSSFIADVQWLDDTVKYLRDVDNRQTISDESRARTHQILSLRAGSLVLSDVTSKMLVTVSERLLFIIPAHQNRPLQILEIPLIVNMEYHRSDGTVTRFDNTVAEAELQLQLHNAGFYILNGCKSAIDQVNLRFVTDEDCNGFCQAMAGSLKKISAGVQTSAIEQLDVDIVGIRPRPKKQSRAVMIELSQDAVVSGDTQVLSRTPQAPHRVSTSLRIDMSATSESSISPISLPSTKAEEAVPGYPKEDNEDPSHDNQQVQKELHQNAGGEAGTGSRTVEIAEDSGSMRRASDMKKSPEKSIAPADPASTSQESIIAYTTGGHLPQQTQHRRPTKSKIRSPVQTPNLQHLAQNALQHSVEGSITTILHHTEPTARSQETSHSKAAQASNDAPPPPLPTLANLGKKMAPKPDSMKQAASSALPDVRKQNEASRSRTSRSHSKPLRAKNTVTVGEAAVDWDEDLRTDQDDKDHSKVSETSKTGKPRSTRNGTKKTAGTKTASKHPPSRKKGPKKDNINGERSEAAAASATLASTRPRRTAANVSYIEQSEQEEQSQRTIGETKDMDISARRRQTSAVASSPSMDNDPNHHQTVSVDDQEQVGAKCGAGAELGDPPADTEVVVEVSRSLEGLPATDQLGTKAEMKDSKKGASDLMRQSHHNQNDGDDKPDHDLPQHTGTVEVEVVDDSHPMDKQKLAEVLGNASKSFGSVLKDVMKESGMQPIEAPLVEAKKKPFGDKPAFVNSVKSALKQTPKGHKIQSSRPGTTKQAQTASTTKQGSNSATRRGQANEILQSARLSDQTRMEESTSRQTLEGRVNLAVVQPTTNASMPKATPERSKRLSKAPTGVHQRPSDINQSSPTKDSVLYENDHKTTPNSAPVFAKQQPWVEDDSPALIMPLSPAPLVDKRRPSAEAGSSAVILPPDRTPSIANEISIPKPRNAALFPSSSNKEADVGNDGRKRSASPAAERRHVKRARKTDPVSGRNQVVNKATQRSDLTPQLTASIPGHGLSTTPRSSEPSIQPNRNIVPSDRALGTARMQRTQQPADRSGTQVTCPGVMATESSTKLVESKAQTPRRGMGLTYLPDHPDHPDIPDIPDDRLHRKAQIIVFSARGPRNQGTISSDRRAHNQGQSNSVPTETGKHLAFKNLHSESRIAGPTKRKIPSQFRLFRGDAKRKVDFLVSDPESTDDGLDLDEESIEDVALAPAILDLETGKSASQTSKVDENGSPRLNVPRPSQISNLPHDFRTLDDSADLEESIGTASAFETPESEGLKSNGSAGFGLKTAVSHYAAANAQMIVKMKNPPRRASIGVGKFLDHSFPQASKNIEIKVFKASNSLDEVGPKRVPRKTKPTDQFHHERDSDPLTVSVLQGRLNDTTSALQDKTPLFDIDQLNVSVANEQLDSAASARVRRLRSSTPSSPEREALDVIASPPSFNTRLGKMIMPPPSRKEQNISVRGKEQERELYLRREQSTLIDAETTLVDAEASEEEKRLSSPQAQQLSSPSSSPSEEDDAPVPSSQQVPSKNLHVDRKFWNEKLAETQQTVTEILEQISQKLLLRFSNAEQGIRFKIDHYHYGGYKILNNFVEQFDDRVTQEKALPSPRVNAYRKLLDDAICRLQQAKGSSRAGPSLHDLEKSRSRRSEYVLANLEKFAATHAS
ncbi:hypothetical protein EPUS_03497 [Endocarpon pusillum Z07020]|uniref:Uncharacterized protein n=1 Tax=Endocarpon pusillum (strain Z07020 / HMAS-L-300199) TaxID=1263415 RepID=U1G249_ENDPU|nr:uncharacterized protein EPUS_03497 [Endocarpon pusillum Z07020]ERF71342.1 hypothetical protein EPUS_03497 [Endocarpon pusillum Z07020]